MYLATFYCYPRVLTLKINHFLQKKKTKVTDFCTLENVHFSCLRVRSYYFVYLRVEKVL